jgi:hypothetical protein
MRLRALLAATVVLGLAAPALAAEHAPVPARADHPPPPASSPPASSPPPPPRHAPSPFAAVLSRQPLGHGPAAWPTLNEATAWRALAGATPATRQATRWRYAQALIARDRGGDALGVLDVMAADDPALARVAAWRRARGIALTLLGRRDAAIAAFDDRALDTDTETCLWRLRSLASARAGTAPAPPPLTLLHCAVPALNARTASARRPFLFAAARAAIDAGRPAPVIAWLQPVAAADPEAALLRGEAELAAGHPAAARRWFALASRAADPGQRAAGTLGVIDTGLADRSLAPGAALRQLAALQFRWRGGPTERRALTTTLTLALRRHDEPAILATGAALLRYCETGADAVPLSAMVQAHLVGLLAADSRVPLATAAGLLWEYRDLVPTGAPGDRMAWMLADRLQQAGLYARAAELLEHRLRGVEHDVEQGPLAVRIATLRILAGMPDAAVRVLRETGMVPYPETILDDRRRVEAIALELLGKHAEALAVLADSRDSRAVGAELQWHARDWPRLVQSGEAMLPAGPLTEAAQVIVLRQAIALAMLGREPALQRLNRRYARAFAPLPTGPVFAMLTAPVGTVDPDRLGRAIEALPAAGPAAMVADLLTAGQAASAR